MISYNEETNTIIISHSGKDGALPVQDLEEAISQGLIPATMIEDSFVLDAGVKLQLGTPDPIMPIPDYQQAAIDIVSTCCNTSVIVKERNDWMAADENAVSVAYHCDECKKIIGFYNFDTCRADC